MILGHYQLVICAGRICVNDSDFNFEKEIEALFRISFIFSCHWLIDYPL